MADIKVIALGGLDERGKNLYTIEINNEILIFDVGLKMPLREMLGIDIIIPDFSYLIENKNKIRAIFISKPADENFGALPYLIKSLNNSKDIKRDQEGKLLITIYGSALTYFMLDQKMKLFRVANWEKIINFKTIDVQNNFFVENTNIFIYPFRTTTSLPGSLGFAVNSSNEQVNHNFPVNFDDTIIYTGDYIFDGRETDDFNMSIKEIGNIRNLNRNKQILMLISEASYASRKSFTAPHHKIQNLLETAIEEAPGRIIFACYDQDLFRINEIFQAISETNCNREVAVHGQHLSEILKAISDQNGNAISKINVKGFNITFNPNDTNKNKTKIISLSEATKNNKAIIIITGSGERLFAKMNKITSGNDDFLTLHDNDTVILATPPLPGNELAHAQVLDELARTDVSVITISDRQTWTVNASYEDIKLFTSMLQPKYFWAIKGLYKDLSAARNAAIDAGVLHNNALVIDNGQVINFKNNALVAATSIRNKSNLKQHNKDQVAITTGDVYVDGIGVGDIGAVVLEERRKLMSDGVLIIGLTINQKTREITSLIDAQMRGVVYLTNNDQMLKEIQAKVINVLKKAKEKPNITTLEIKNKLKNELQDYIEKTTGKKPMILPVINEVQF